MTDDEKDAEALKVAREMGPAVESMVRRFVENRQRRRSPDPRQREYQAEYDRQTLDHEWRVMYYGKDTQ